MSFDLELSGRRVLVTAGTKGVGAAAFGLFRELGAQVLTTGRTRPDSLPEEMFVVADLTTAEGCIAVEQAVDGPGATASDARTPLRRHHPRDVNPGSASIAGIHDGIRCRQGGALDLQQESIEGSGAQRRARCARLAGMGRNGSLHRDGEKAGGASWHRLRGRQADHNEFARRDSARASVEANRSGEPHRIPGVCASVNHHGHGVRDRWRQHSCRIEQQRDIASRLTYQANRRRADARQVDAAYQPVRLSAALGGDRIPESLRIIRPACQGRHRLGHPALAPASMQ